MKRREKSEKAGPKPEERPTERPRDENQPRVRGKPFVKGDKRINRTKGGPGRRKNAYKKWCKRVLENPRTKRAVRRILHDEGSKAFPTMYKELAARAYGKPEQPVKLDATLKLEDLLDASHGDDDDES